MDVQGYIEAIFYEGVAQNMVYVTMRVKDHYYIQLCLLNVFCQFLLFLFLVTTGIHYDAVKGLVIQQVGIFLEGVEYKTRNV